MKTKRLLAAIISMALLLVLLPTAAFAADISGAVASSATWNDGDTITGTVTITGGTEANPVVITVNGTVTLNATVNVSSGYVKFTGGGTLKRGSAFDDDDMIKVSGGNVTFEKIVLDGNNVGCDNHQALYVSGVSNIIINEGTVIQNCENTNKTTSTGCGSAICAYNGTVHITMNGGEIKNNTQQTRGAIYLDSSSVANCTFTMNGGSVTENTCINEKTSYGGGAFYVRSATLTVNGGAISGNSVTTDATAGKGGGIYCTSYGKVELNGGVISSNTANIGSGIYFSSQAGTAAELYIGGDTLISGNEIYLDNAHNTAKFPFITSAIKNPLPLVVNAYTEDRIVAKGNNNHMLTEADMAKVNIKTADGTWYYAKLDSANNRMLMTKTDPDYTVYYNVTYYGNGGTGSVSDGNNYVSGAAVTVKSNVFSRIGYGFIGWSTAANGIGATYAPGDTFNITADTALYAQWLVGQYPVTCTLTGLTANGTAMATHEAAYTTTLSAAAHYSLPAAITVEVAGNTLAAGTDYTYSAATGAVAINAEKVTGAITITAMGTHVHSWAEAWTTDATHHWHECEAADCTITENSAKFSYGEHVYDNDSDATCNTCPYTRTVTPFAPELIRYEIIEGKNGTWTKDASRGLGFTANADYAKFTGVWVDYSLISSDKYAVQSGSTVVTLSPAYLETLPVGEHTLWVYFTDGFAETRFTIAAGPDIPQTGDESTALIWLGVMLTAGAVLAAGVVCGRKRRV